jgi:hypothetical protein
MRLYEEDRDRDISLVCSDEIVRTPDVRQILFADHVHEAVHVLLHSEVPIGIASPETYFNEFPLG